MKVNGGERPRKSRKTKEGNRKTTIIAQKINKNMKIGEVT